MREATITPVLTPHISVVLSTGEIKKFYDKDIEIRLLSENKDNVGLRDFKIIDFVRKYGSGYPLGIVAYGYEKA